MEIYERTDRLIGKEARQKLNNSTVAVFGLGGVGSYVAEALARAGVGKLIIVDGDRVAESNINRQLYALKSTVGQYKTDVAKKRIEDINPDITVVPLNIFYSADNKDAVEFGSCDYVVDAIDTVSSKLIIIEEAFKASVPVITCMGTGNRLDASKLLIDKIENTEGCPLARVMRRELKNRKIKGVSALYSKELPYTEIKDGIIPSISFVPSAAGLLIASRVVKDIISL